MAFSRSEMLQQEDRGRGLSEVLHEDPGRGRSLTTGSFSIRAGLYAAAACVLCIIASSSFLTPLAFLTSLAFLCCAVYIAAKSYHPGSKERAEQPVAPSPDELGPKGRREVQKKQRLKERHEQGKGAAAGGLYEGGVPPGNFNTPSFLRTDLGKALPPEYTLSEEAWSLELRFGERFATVDMALLRSLPAHEFKMPWSCVTGWTKTDLIFTGVPLAMVLQLVVPPMRSSGDGARCSPEGKAAARVDAAAWSTLYQRSADGYTAPLYKEDLRRAFVALTVGGEPLGLAHGGPRVVVPHLWGWKSAKWLTSLELLSAYKAGFWETVMCHPRGRVYAEDSRAVLQERWKPGLGRVSDFATSLANAWHHVLGPGAYAAVMEHGGRAVGVLGGLAGILQQRPPGGRRPKDA